MRIEVAIHLWPALAALSLAGCAAERQIPTDMTGVEPAAYNRDTAECEQRLRTTSFALGDVRKQCMIEKGYKF